MCIMACNDVLLQNAVPSPGSPFHLDADERARRQQPKTCFVKNTPHTTISTSAKDLLSSSLDIATIAYSRLPMEGLLFKSMSKRTHIALERARRATSEDRHLMTVRMNHLPSKDFSSRV